MLDFLTISTRKTKGGSYEVYPRFRLYPKSQDLMIRGGDFYAVWVEDRGLWSTNEDELLYLIDHELEQYAKEHEEDLEGNYRVLRMQDSDSGMIDSWHKYCQKQLRDSFNMLDEKLIFANTETNKKDYASKRLEYPLEAGDTPAWNKLISTLYTEEERHKIEWAIGSIISGDSKELQKFMVLYGSAGTGKSTILNIIQKLFNGYYCVFDAKALGSNGSQFALEAFRKNPLVAIQHDGDLSKIEDNTRLNSLVSHEEMLVNEKYSKGYENRFKCFLFMGTNKPVRITDAKSGLIRRLIDVTPSGNKLSARDYKHAVKQVDFELGAIAQHCLNVYLDSPDYYNEYIPSSMMGATNDFYNFIIDSYHIFKKEDGTTLKAAWEMYKTYCDEAKIPYPMQQRVFKEELKNYFKEYNERFNLEDGSRSRNYYSGFLTDKFSVPNEQKKEPEKVETRVADYLDFKEHESIFDKECANCIAQLASEDGTPIKKWENVNTKLSDIVTSELHYVQVPENHIVIDFDIPDENGNKCLALNLEAASKWPPTYAELSKSGQGIHLHYIYSGDATKLSRIYDDHIEVKVFTGNSSLRRKLTKCNDLPIATISSGLPLKGEDKMINFEGVRNEKAIRTLIKKNLLKEVHASTKCSIDFINKILEDAYNNGTRYDVSDMFNDVFAFAANSTNQADYCIRLVNEMKFKSEEQSDNLNDTTITSTITADTTLVFYDIEIFPNLFLVNYKLQGTDNPVVRMINPSPTEIDELLRFKLVGFNNRRYDNHILYGRLMGYTNERLYDLSQRLINGDRDAFFGQAYNLSYTDVYDFSNTKQSLKKWEIDLGIHHQELGLPWDQPVPEEKWEEVAEYCDNDVIATEAVFNHLKADWTARQILADLAEMTVNDSTNSLTARIIFGQNRNPQNEFNYRDMGKVTSDAKQTALSTDEYTVFDIKDRPIFPGYKYEYGVSTYRREEVGEGGYVYAEPGIYHNVALLDIASMHPASIIAEDLFGPYTKNFKDLRDARIAIKHSDYDTVRVMLDGKLAKYLSDEYSPADLAYAIKIPINMVYGQTAAKYPNPFRDPRNVDNIVAKRGALFMVNLKHEVQKKGFTVAHIKTDSIKVPNATPEIIEFITNYGKQYGYDFEHEATYDRMCFVNDAVYIAKYRDGKHAGEWTATGKQFQVPYVFKKLFSREEILFEDMCEAMSVTSALYLDMNEGLEDVSMYETVLSIRKSNKAVDDITKKERMLVEQFADISDEDLANIIARGHDYRFIGKVGNFCPIRPGCGGGELLREAKDKNGDIKYAAATGTKGYRWLESEMVKTLNKQDDIDNTYYIAMVDTAVTTISKYGDFEAFVS